MTADISVHEARDVTVGELVDAIRTLVDIRNAAASDSPSFTWASDMKQAREAIGIAAQAIDVMLHTADDPEPLDPEDIDRLRLVRS